MYTTQAKRLKVGDRVVWTKGDAVEGTVIRKRYNTIWIRWDDGVEKTHYADLMDHVFTPKQLADEVEQKAVVEKVKAYNADCSRNPFSEDQMPKTPKTPNIPVAVEREVERLRARVKELESVGRMAHDTLADLAGRIGPSLATTEIDPTFRELVRVLFIDK